MRKVLLITTATVGGVVVLIAAVLIYAALHLNSIVKSDRQYVLGRISDSLGRDVQAQDIKIGLGWGVSLEVTGLRIADDPAFSQLPFLKARQVSGQVEVLALLSGQILVSRLAILNPDVRILRDGAGRLNVFTLGPQGAAGKPAPAHERAGRLPIRFLVQSLSMRDGAIFYQDVSGKGSPIQVGHVNLDLSDVSPTRPFAVKLGLAAMSGAQNLAVSGPVGPLMRGGALEVMDAPLSFSVSAGPILLDRLRNFPELRSRVPNKLSMPDPFTVHAKIKGTARAMTFDVETDLGSARLVYLGLFHKPAGTAFQISAAGFRRDATVEITQAKIKLADLQARLSDLKFGNGAWSAKVDTNRFELGPLAKMAAALAKYVLSGSSEAHLAIASAAPMPRAQGTLELAGVGFKVEGSQLPGIGDLTGTVRMDGNSATLEPTNFNLGSAHASLRGQASSLQPLRASYSFHADGFKLAELVPQRPADEQVSQLTAEGTVAMRPDGLAVATALTSGQGMVANVPYRNLALRADYDGRQANVTALTLNTYGGSIAAKGDAVLAAPRPFHASVNLGNVDLQQALTAQKAKAAEVVRGLLTGQINAAGKGANFEEIKPTLQGNGRIQINNGKLMGVNVVGSALRKISGIPVINTLITPSVIARHPALFNSTDTDLKVARLSYVMAGPRMTSRDITVDSDDYRILGSGWFDMDKNVELAVHILMSRQFSSDLQAEKKNVAYLENQDGQIEIPLLVSGTLPHPLVQPDVQFLVQRAATHAAEQQGGRLLNKYLGNKGVGKYLGGGGPPGGNPPSNPIAPLKNLFH